MCNMSKEKGEMGDHTFPTLHKSTHFVAIDFLLYSVYGG